jgi:glycosyltransferase involved in cell wall biosynthesis
MRDRIRDLINHANLWAAGLKRVHLVNLLFYEQIQSRRMFRARFTLMPHPVPANPRLSQADSRRMLGIPEDGRYIGLVASIDSRKAVDEFLAAFRAAAAKPNERLLLAGWINGTHLRTIEGKYGDLLQQRRVILVKGFLDPLIYQAALTALDIVCTPYPRFGGLSSTLLEGVAAGRPILANSFGWSQAVVKRFRLGWTCDVLNHEAFTRTIRAAFDQSDEYRESQAATRLLAFHAPENFAETWVHGIRRELGRPAQSARTWDWVMESIPEPDRHLV